MRKLGRRCDVCCLRKSVCPSDSGGACIHRRIWAVAMPFLCDLRTTSARVIRTATRRSLGLDAMRWGHRTVGLSESRLNRRRSCWSRGLPRHAVISQWSNAKSRTKRRSNIACGGLCVRRQTSYHHVIARSRLYDWNRVWLWGPILGRPLVRIVCNWCDVFLDMMSSNTLNFFDIDVSARPKTQVFWWVAPESKSAEWCARW